MLKGSSEDESEQGPILSNFDNTSETDGSTLLFNPGGSVDLPGIHPPPMQIFNLWQVFLDNVHPLLRLFHAPTIQQQLLKSASSLSTASPPMHALLLTIYSNAVGSMRDDACMAALNEDRGTLICRYNAGAQYALHKAGFLRASDLTVLQAFVLHLVSVDGFLRIQCRCR